MSTTGGPGQGGTVALSVDTVISRVRSIQLPEWVCAEVDFTGLSELDWFQFLPANLKDGNTAVVEMFHNSEIALPTVRLIQDITLTLPIQTDGNLNPATVTGSGFVTSLQLPGMVTGEPMMQVFTFRFDNVGTAPTYTAETA